MYFFESMIMNKWTVNITKVFFLMSALLSVSCADAMMTKRPKVKVVTGLPVAGAAATVPAMALYGLLDKLPETSRLKSASKVAPVLAFAVSWKQLRSWLDAKLVAAVRREDRKAIEKWLKLGANPQALANGNVSVLSNVKELIAAAKHKDFALLKAKYNDLHGERQQSSVLQMACDKEDVDPKLVELLLKYGANPNTLDKRVSLHCGGLITRTQQTIGYPLRSACTDINLPVVNALIKYGADVNLRGTECSEPLVATLHQIADSIKKGSRSEEARDKIFEALAIFDNLVAHGADVKKVSRRFGRDGQECPLLVGVCNPPDEDLTHLSNLEVAHATVKDHIVRTALSKYDLEELGQLCQNHGLNFSKLGGICVNESKRAKREVLEAVYVAARRANPLRVVRERERFPLEDDCLDPKLLVQISKLL
jgi:hypothetical protein